MSIEHDPLWDGTANPARRSAVEASHDGALALTQVDHRADDADVLAFRRYVKTVPTYATRIPVAFAVDTLEGRHQGKAGDYLAIGAHGEMYPIDAGVMASTYREEPAP